MKRVVAAWLIASACAGRAAQVEDADDVQRAQRLPIVSVTGALAFGAGGGFLVYGLHDRAAAHPARQH